LGENGIEVALATMGPPPSAEQQSDVTALAAVELFQSAFRLEWMEDPWIDLRRAGEWLLGLEERVRPDLIHLNSFAHGDLPWRAPTVVVGHSCVLSWWEAVKVNPLLLNGRSMPAPSAEDFPRLILRPRQLGPC